MPPLHDLISSRLLALSAIKFPILLSATLLGGCVVHPSALDQVYSKYERDRAVHYSTSPINPNDDPTLLIVTPEQRNDVIEDFVLLIDNHYQRYEDHIRRFKSYSDFGGDVVSGALNLAGTLTGSKADKTTFAALAAAVTATKTSFNKDVLFDQTIPVIITKMEALRAKKLTQIRSLMKDKDRKNTSLAFYSMKEALTDLNAYYNAGSVSRALTSVSEDASIDKKAAEAKLQELKTGRFVEDDAGIVLRKYWMPDGKTVNADHQAKIIAEMEAISLDGVPVEFFLDSDNLADQRKAVARKLGLTK